MRVSPITNMRFSINNTEKSVSHIGALKPDSFKKSPSFGAIKIDETALAEIKNKGKTKNAQYIFKRILEDSIKAVESNPQNHPALDNLNLLLIPKVRQDEYWFTRLIEQPLYYVDVQATFRNPKKARETIIKTNQIEYAEGNYPEGEDVERILKDLEGLKTRDKRTMYRLAHITQKCCIASGEGTEALINHFPEALESNLESFIKSTTYKVNAEFPTVQHFPWDDFNINDHIPIY